MTYWTDTQEFRKYEEAFGSKFAAINYVSLVARRRRASVDNCISESQALAWVVTGVEPKDIQLYREAKKLAKQRADMYIEDRLCYIEDVAVKDAVRITIQESREKRHLIYNYNNILDDCTKARVRIISNMVWDELRQLYVENHI
jgi:hypothetical protein